MENDDDNDAHLFIRTILNDMIPTVTLRGSIIAFYIDAWVGESQRRKHLGGISCDVLQKRILKL